MGELSHLIVPTLMVATAAAIMLWMAGAIYYDVCGGGRWGRLVAVTWSGGVLVLFVLWQPLWQPFVVLLGALALFLGCWWYRQKPSHHRDWDPTVAVLPRDCDAYTVDCDCGCC